MATLAAMASGNFTDAATWKTIINEVDSELGTYTVLTTYRTSTGFVASGESCSGIGIKLASATNANAGITFTVELYNVIDGTIDATVTVNKIDMVCETALSATPTWVFFSFSPVTMTSGKTYSVRCKETTSSAVTLYGNGSSISYLMISNTTASPSSGDKLLISGNLTGAGTGNDVEVTMDNTAATSFGGIMIGRRGTLRYSTSPGSLYKLVIGGNAMGATSGSRGIEIANSGLLEIGSLLSGMPASATGQLQLNCGSAVSFGIECRTLGRMTTYGSPKLSYTRLATTASGTATVLQVASNSGWQVGDTIGIAGNRRVISQHESRVISSLISSTGVVITAGLTNAHDGGNNVQGDNVGAHIINMTENIQIFGGSVTLSTYLNLSAASQISMNNTEFYWLGSSTANKRGIDIGNTTGTFSMYSCSLHDNSISVAISVNIVSNSIGVVVSNCSFYNTQQAIIVGQTSSFATIDSNCIIGNNAGQPAIQMNDAGSIVTNNICSGGSFGIYINEAAALGTYSGNIIYTMGTAGLSFGATVPSGTISTITIFRITGTGPIFSGSTVLGINSPIVIDSAKLFGNTSINLYFNSQCHFELNNSTLYSESSFSTATGISLSGFSGRLYCHNNSFTHTSTDISFSTSGFGLVTTTNCVFNSPNEFGGISTVSGGTIVSSHNHDAIIGSHSSYKKNGRLDTDTVKFVNYAPSLKMTPSSSSLKLTSEGIKGNPSVYVGAGKSITATVMVRTSLVASGDATTYNGSFPRLINKRNYGLGITSDTVLATATVATSGSFLAISGTTSAVSATGVLEFYVDCDGTTGFVNVDDWSFYQNN